LRIHIVQKGEILAHIAEKYGVHFDDLRQANPQLSSPDMLLPGMKIKIPGEVKSVRNVRDQSSSTESSDGSKEQKKLQTNRHLEHEMNHAHTAERPRADAIIPDEKHLSSNILNEQTRTTRSGHEAMKSDAGKNEYKKRAVRINPTFDEVNEKMKTVKNESENSMGNKIPYDERLYSSPHLHYNEQMKQQPHVPAMPVPYNRCCCCLRQIDYPYYGPPMRPWHQHFYY